MRGNSIRFGFKIWIICPNNSSPYIFLGIMLAREICSKTKIVKNKFASQENRLNLCNLLYWCAIWWSRGYFQTEVTITVNIHLKTNSDWFLNEAIVNIATHYWLYFDITLIYCLNSSNITRECLYLPCWGTWKNSMNDIFLNLLIFFLELNVTNG